MSSTDKVLRTPELFELILLELPLRTLLTRASLVSKQWRNHITSSLPLQRALFFKTCPPGTSARVNPLMAADFPIFFDDNEHHMGSFHLLPFADSLKDNNSKHSRIAGDGNVAEGPSVPPKTLTPRAAFLHPSASWRRMMPRQPAVDEPVFWRDVFNRRYRGVGNLSISCKASMKTGGYDGVSVDEHRACAGIGPEGWTMGALYDKAYRVACGRRRFRVFWDVQAHIRREAQEFAEAVELGLDPGSDDGITDAKVPVRNRDGKVPKGDTTNEEVLEEDMSDEELSEDDMPDVMTLVDALGGREVVFQTIDQIGCRAMGAGMNPRITSMVRRFERYYAFPAAELDAKSVDP